MPTPISSHLPGQPLATELEIGPPPPPPPVVTIDPVYITGDAAATQLIQRHDADTPPCRVETAKAVEGVLPMAIDVAGTLGAAVAAPLMISVGIAKLFHDSIQEGEALRHLYDCKTR